NVLVASVCSFFFSSRRRHTRSKRDWSSDVCSSDLSWGSFFQWLKGRGLDGVKLIVGDKCLGMLEAVSEVLPGAKYQRCTVQFCQIGRASCRERGERTVRVGGWKEEVWTMGEVS